MATTATFGPILRPDQVGDLVIHPLIAQSIAGQCLTSVVTGSTSYRIPVVNTDPSAAWVSEASELPVSDGDVSEINVPAYKLAALTVLSSELANDSDPAAVDVVGQGIVRDLTRKVDQALFTAATVDGPAGIPSLSGITTVSAGSSYSNIDAFSDAVYSAEQVNATLTAWVTNPATAKTLAKVKELSGSNKPLLAPDPTVPGRRQILGVPLLTSPYVSTTNNVVWGISQQYSYMVIREQAEIESDASVFFTSDRIAVRSILRVGLGFPHPASIIKISTS